MLIFGLAISCADQKTEAAQNTIESDLVSSVEKDRPNGITTLVVTGNVHGQLDPCG